MAAMTMDSMMTRDERHIFIALVVAVASYLIYRGATAATASSSLTMGAPSSTSGEDYE